MITDATNKEKIDIFEIEERGLTRDAENYIRPIFKWYNFFKYGERGGFWELITFGIKFSIVVFGTAYIMTGAIIAWANSTENIEMARQYFCK